MKYLSIIEDYFLGKLEGNSLDNFNSDLLTNPELKNEFETYKRAIEFIMSQGRTLINDLGRLKDFELDPSVFEDIEKYGTKNIHDKNETQIESLIRTEEKKHLRKSIRRSNNFKWYKIAASLLLITGFGIAMALRNQGKSDENELFIKYFTPYHHSFSSRSLSNSFNQIIVAGVQLYDAGLYEQALDKFREIPDSIRIVSEVNIIESVCLIKTEQYNKAIDILDKINSNNLLFYTSLWYKGLCYLKLKEDDKAKEIFKVINTYEPFYKEETQKLLRNLK